MDSKTLQTLRRDAEDICRSAIEASVPDAAIQRALAQLPPCQGRTVLVSIGKAGWQTAKAAYDALGSTIEMMISRQRRCQPHQRDDRVLFVIMTDGLENASTRWTYAQLQRLIEQEKVGHGWEFLFLGANMDAVKEASRLGIAPERTASFINDSEGIEINFRCVSKAMKYFRACEELDDSGWKAEVEHDQCRRG